MVTPKLLQNEPTYLRIKVLPNASKNAIISLMDDGETWKIKIKAAPEKGKANAELIKFIAKELGIHKEGISIISGKRERVKLVKLRLSSEISPRT